MPRRNASPEHDFQVMVAQYLDLALPAGVLFTASDAGAHMSKATAIKAKRAGRRKGWPDIMIMPPDGVCRFIELKARSGLSDEQKVFRDTCRRSGTTVWAMARTLEQVEAALLSFDITPRYRLR